MALAPLCLCLEASQDPGQALVGGGTGAGWPWQATSPRQDCPLPSNLLLLPLPFLPLPQFLFVCIDVAFSSLMHGGGGGGAIIHSAISFLPIFPQALPKHLPLPGGWWWWWW